MLDKILNINENLNYKQNEQKLKQRSSSKKYFDSANLGGDKINISSSLMYISTLGWHLKELKNIQNEKIFITFLFSDFEFQSEIDIYKLKEIRKLFLKVIQEKLYHNHKYLIGVDFSIDINNVDLDNKIYFLELTSLSSLFQNILEYGSVININDIGANNLSGNTNEELFLELFRISNSILVFIKDLKDVNLNFRNLSDKSVNQLKILNINSVLCD